MVLKLMENMAALFNEIRSCFGKENCWGKINPKCLKPVVLLCRQHPEAMIVTEQMNVHKEECSFCLFSSIVLHAI